MEKVSAFHAYGSNVLRVNRKPKGTPKTKKAQKMAENKPKGAPKITNNGVSPKQKRQTNFGGKAHRAAIVDLKAGKAARNTKTIDANVKKMSTNTDNSSYSDELDDGSSSGSISASESGTDSASESECCSGCEHSDENSSGQLTEYTLNTGSSSSSAATTPVTVPAARRRAPASNKRKEDDNNNNNEKQITVAATPKKRKDEEHDSNNNRKKQKQQSDFDSDSDSDSDSDLASKQPLTVMAGNANMQKGGKNARQPAGKQSKVPPQGSEQRRTSETAAPSCPLLRVSGAATAIKSCALNRKATAGPQLSKTAPAAKSCALPPRKSAGETAAVLPNKIEENDGAEKTDQLQRTEAHLSNSIVEGKRMLSWLINPLSADQFFAKFWEQKASHMSRSRPNYFSKLISFSQIDEMLIQNHLEFTTNIDVTTYIDGVRSTLNPEGRAMPPVVWGHYEDGCSIRILNPTTYLIELQRVCSILQEYFHCLVGANVYLTPPNSQGFAPHYDDIEAFVLQVEGRKRWRLYAPPSQTDVLALTSSGNLKQEDLSAPIMDVVLKPGDMLYFPRGTVHQAITEKDHHSLHITLSVYQQQSYGNLLEKLMPVVLQRAIKHKVQLRRGLPLNTWQHLGLACGSRSVQIRSDFIAETKKMVLQYLMPTEGQIDAAVDQLAKRFQHEALPPIITPEERIRTVFGSRSTTDAHGQCVSDYDLKGRTQIRLLRANILRIVAENSTLRIYFYVDNALEYCKYEANFMEIDPQEAAAVEILISTYPKYMKIDSLPMPSDERRIEVATALWERGLLMTKKPFREE